MKKKTLIFSLITMFAVHSFGQSHTLTADFKPKSANGYAFRGNVSISLGRRGLAPDETITIDTRLSASNISYIYNGKTYTASDFAEIGSSVVGWFEIGLKYENNPTVWISTNTSTITVDKKSTTFSQLGVSLPKIINITEQNTAQNAIAYNKNVDASNKSKNEYSDAQSAALKKIRVEIRNYYSGGNSSIESKIQQKQMENSSSSGNSSSNRPSGSSSSSSRGSGTYSSGGSSSGSSSSGSGSSSSGSRGSGSNNTQRR